MGSRKGLSEAEGGRGCVPPVGLWGGWGEMKSAEKRPLARSPRVHWAVG